ncbi:MAG: HAD-IA family hydrolase [Fimbriimonadaceae bacterium]
MSIKVISFDAAHTLVDVDWNPGDFATQMVNELGEFPDPQVAAETYNNLLYSRWGHFRELNLQRSQDICQQFWRELTADWSARLALRTDPAKLSEHANVRIYADDSPVYRVFADTIPCLQELKRQNWRMIVVSNWDVSLHLVLEAFGIGSYFEQVFASLEWGPEKPEIELFRIVESEMNLGPESFFHIGDNPLDDFHGAKSAGWRAALIDRSLEKREGLRLSSLLEVSEVVLG